MNAPTKRQRQLTRKVRKTLCSMDLAASAPSQLCSRAVAGLMHLRHMGCLDQFNTHTDGNCLHVEWTDQTVIGWTRCIFDVKSLNPGSMDADDVMDICEDVMES